MADNSANTAKSLEKKRHRKIVSFSDYESGMIQKACWSQKNQVANSQEKRKKENVSYKVFFENKKVRRLDIGSPEVSPIAERIETCHNVDTARV